MTPLAFFITPHGFGHAARACAVMVALHKQHPAYHFHLFTRVPLWFFEESLQDGEGQPIPFTYHEVLTDIGMVQHTSLVEDVAASVERLGTFFPFTDARIQPLAETVTRLGCAAVFCDIAPMGIAVAQAAGLPAVLEENFTWDWIYEAYVADCPAMQPFVTYLQGLFAKADLHIYTEPVRAMDRQAAPPDQRVAPVSREARTPASVTRDQLGIAPDEQMVLLTMGGFTWSYTHLDRLARFDQVRFIIPGGTIQTPVPDNVHLLGTHSEYYHPDLMMSCDAVIGKVGYSTVAEVYQAGVPFGYIPRERFMESRILTAFIKKEMHGIHITGADFETGAWIDKLHQLLALPRRTTPVPNGADQVATLWHRYYKTLLSLETPCVSP